MTSFLPLARQKAPGRPGSPFPTGHNFTAHYSTFTAETVSCATEAIEKARASRLARKAGLLAHGL